PAINQQDVRKNLLLARQTSKPASHRLTNGSKVVNSLDRPDAISAIAGLEGQTINKADQRRHGLITAQMSDVHSFDSARSLAQAEHFAQAMQTLFRLDGKDFGLHIALDVAAHAKLAQGLNLIAQSSRLFEL